MSSRRGAGAARVGGRPSPSISMIAGVALALAGYLLPWFRPREYEWSYSGIALIRRADGGPGWTVLVLLALAVALVAAVWAGGSEVAAWIAGIASVAAAFFAGVVIAACLSAIDSDYIDDVTALVFGIGIPVMAIGFGLAVVGAVHAIAAALVDDLEDRVRRSDPR